MRLAPFLPAHAELVASWAATPLELDRWASLDKAPTAATFAGWLAEPGCHAYVLLWDHPIGYGEMWVSIEEDEVELGHLLVAPGCRNQGSGRALVALLIQEARTLPISTAWVRVVPQNVAALRCYAAAGFVRASDEVEAQFNAIQPRPYRWLSVAL